MEGRKSVPEQLGPESESTLLNIMETLSGKVNAQSESHWHFSVEAPRWAVRSPGKNTTTYVLAGVAAFLLGASGFWLAWHAIDKLTGSKSPLAVQIGPWAAVAALLASAGIAVYAAMGNGRLQLRITQLTGDESAAKALAASASGQADKAGSAEINAAARIGIAAEHAAAADEHAAAAVSVADQVQASAPAAASALASAASAHASVAGAAMDAGSALTNASSSIQDPSTTISPKVWAGSIAGAASFSFWTIAAATFWKSTFSSDALAALVGSTTTVVSAVAAYLRTDPLRVKAKA